MSKRIRLLCNAHIAPVWQWECEEGATETVEEYDPQLFMRIQSLAKAGKWNIIGIQPGCNMPSSEAMVRQILSGRQYFIEMFQVVPTPKMYLL